MKTLLILVATFLVSATASAHTPTASDSWDTIRSHYNKVEVDEPSLRLDVGAFTTSAFFVCIDGDQLRTLKKFTKCLEWSDDDDDSSRWCLREKKYYGTAKIQSTRERCTAWEDIDSGDSTETICTEYQQYTYTHPLSYDVDVYRENDEDEYRGRKLFTKKLIIKDCK